MSRATRTQGPTGHSCTVALLTLALGAMGCTATPIPLPLAEGGTISAFDAGASLDRGWDPEWDGDALDAVNLDPDGGDHLVDAISGSVDGMIAPGPDAGLTDGGAAGDNGVADGGGGAEGGLEDAGADDEDASSEAGIEDAEAPEDGSPLGDL